MRDDFTEETKRAIGTRVALKCSKPDCRAATSGPQADLSKAVNVGVAAHITAASPGGPRYNASLTDDDRSSPRNAIWLCQNCAKLVDNDPVRFTVEVLQMWKRDAEHEAEDKVGKTSSPHKQHDRPLTEPEEQLLRSAAHDGVIQVLETDQLGKWVRSGRDFVDQTDPVFAAIYYEALEELLLRGLVTHAGGILYRLTGKGFALARQLTERAPQG